MELGPRDSVPSIGHSSRELPESANRHHSRAVLPFPEEAPLEFRMAALRLWTAAPVIFCCLAPSFAAEPVASFTIRADWFDRGNVRVSDGEGYADRYACIWNAGQLPNQAEYDLDFPVTADYTLVALYAAETSRPVDIYLDGEKVHRGLAGVTGSWQTSTARWETQCTVHVTAGRHTIKLVCPGSCIATSARCGSTRRSRFRPAGGLIASRLDARRPRPARRFRRSI